MDKFEELFSGTVGLQDNDISTIEVSRRLKNALLRNEREIRPDMLLRGVLIEAIREIWSLSKAIDKWITEK